MDPAGGVPSAAGDDPAGSGPIVAGRDLEDQATPRVQRPDGGRELARLAGESGIPEAVDEGDRGVEPTLVDARRGEAQPDELSPGNRGPDLVEGDARRQVPGDRAEDVAAVEGRRGVRQPEVAVLEESRFRHTPDAVDRRHQEAVVRTDEHVAAAGPDRDRPSVRADSGVDDSDVDPDGQKRDRGPEEEGAVTDRVLPDAVAEV